MWKEFVREAEKVLGMSEKPRIAGERDELPTIDESIGLLDSMFWTATSEDAKRESCLQVAANAYRLYQAYREGKQAEVRNSA